MSSNDLNQQSRPIDWLRYSGASVTITLNPLHWKLVPTLYKEYDGWLGPNERTWRMAWLMLGLRVWIDNGSW